MESPVHPIVVETQRVLQVQSVPKTLPAPVHWGPHDHESTRQEGEETVRPQHSRRWVAFQDKIPFLPMTKQTVDDRLQKGWNQVFHPPWFSSVLLWNSILGPGLVLFPGFGVDELVPARHTIHLKYHHED